MLNDIVSTTFNRKFIHEIFIKHQPIYSKNVLRLMFDRLSNASTMRLYGESFDKVSTTNNKGVCMCLLNYVKQKTKIKVICICTARRPLLGHSV